MTIVCDTRDQLTIEITRVYTELLKLKDHEKIKSGYILYTINNDSLDPHFIYELSKMFDNNRDLGLDIRFTYKGHNPCKLNRCVANCGYCKKEKTQDYCNCSWGREYFNYTFWRSNEEPSGMFENAIYALL